MNDRKEIMIKLRNIAKRYNTKAGFTYVLQQINLDIAEGEFVTIMGPSAAGKSTSLNILGLLDHDWEGEYELDGQAVHLLKALISASVVSVYPSDRFRTEVRKVAAHLSGLYSIFRKGAVFFA